MIKAPSRYLASCLYIGMSLAGPASGALLTAESAVHVPDDRKEIIHVLERITFGPRPGDVERVETMGFPNYIDQQLHPERIDDAAVEQRLSNLNTLQFTGRELMSLYHEELQQNIVRQLSVKTADESSDAQRDAARQRAEVELQKLQLFAGAMPVNATPEERQAILQRMLSVRTKPVAELAEAKLVRAADSRRQLYEVLVDFWGNHFNIDMDKGSCQVLKVADDRDVIRPHVLGSFRDLLGASAKSPAMLYYLDNFLNSVGQAASAPATGSPDTKVADNENLPAAADKQKKRSGGINENYAREIMELHTLGVDGGYTQADVQEVARSFTGWTFNKNGEFQFVKQRHDNGEKIVLGHQIPANGGIKDGEMVLDILASHPSTAHFISRELCERFIGDSPPVAAVDRAAAVFLQTDGDLREVVRCILTSPEFRSAASFGSKIKSPLEFAVSAVRATGSTVRLPPPAPPEPAGSPAGTTAAAIPSVAMGGSALARPAVTGNPVPAPPATPTVMAEIMALVDTAPPTAPTVHAKPPPRLTSKPKRQSLDYHILAMGEPLFGCIPPTGYKEVSSNWVNPGALIDRLNFALALTEQSVSDVQFDMHNILGQQRDLDQPEAVLNECIAALLPGGISDSTRAVLSSAAIPAPGESKVVEPAKLVALILGSPEFQRK